MNSRAFAGALVVVFLLSAGFPPPAMAADPDATLFRVFLKDGTSLVSYGEFARLGDRVVFSMPTGSPGLNPPLHLVNLSAERVDWDRTTRYAEAARAGHYVTTRAEDDYAALTSEVARTLNDVALTNEPARQLPLVESARKALAEWPQAHFGYRQNDVRQMLSMLDEAIADLRAAAGGERFDLALVAYTVPPPFEPLLPAPTPKEAIEQTLLMAQLTESPAERTSLLHAVLVGLDRDAASFPADWAAAKRADTSGRIEAELKIDRAYQTLTARIMAQVNQRARRAEVRGLERMLDRIRLGDAALGGQRPDAVNALVAAVETQLDAARRLRLARDRWALRAPDYRRYRAAINPPIDLFARLKPALEDIRSLAGSTPGSLASIRRVVAQILKAAVATVPPDELRAAHALLVSAAQMADNAALIRREAALSGDLARAWDASSAAAGALMLGSRARTEIRALLRPPQLP